MAHEKTYGICEDKCQVEVYSKEEADETFAKQSDSGSFAIKNHATSESTYGLGTATQFGHVKVINDFNKPSGDQSGRALAAAAGYALAQRIADAEKNSNLYIITASASANISSIIGSANTGISIYSIVGVGTSQGYPVNVPIKSMSSNRAIITIVKSGSAMVLFEYENELYYCHYYTDTQGIHLGEWKNVSEVNDTGWITLSLASGVTAATTGAGIPQYRKIGNHVFVRGSVSFDVPSSGSTTIATLPTGYRPNKVPYDVTACANNRLAQKHINSSGGIVVDYVVNVTDGSRYSGVIDWLDISLDFFID